VVVVFGSINVDLVTRVQRFPRPGETVVGESFAVYAGGKGGNQALAAARSGAEVRLYGAVGDDAFADVALARLSAAGVGLDGVVRGPEPTGSATILVDSQAENCIVIAAGANARADPQSVPDAALGPATTLVLQQEVPERANAALIERARSRGASIVLNAAPAREITLELLTQLDVLIVNETEAATLADSLRWPGETDSFVRAATAACPRLTVALTLGSRGAIARNALGKISAAPPLLDVVDTTGAGDAFVGALAAAFDRGAALRDALARAVAAGALACTAHGAQASLPNGAAIEAMLAQVTTAGEY
jgi:ribokinase